MDQLSYGNRWQQVTPVAKAVLALCGIVAAFLASSPAAAVAVALSMAALTIVGAGISPFLYLRVAAPAMFFLGISSITLIFSFSWDFATGSLPVIIMTNEGFAQASRLSGRAVASLASLMLLSLTTPMNEIIAMLRRLKVPELLLDLMVIGYRMLFVLSDSIHGIRTAQAARLGYSSWRYSLRSLGLMFSNLTVQIWQRSAALHLSAISRNCDGPLRFMERRFPNRARDISIATAAGIFLLAFTILSR